MRSFRFGLSAAPRGTAAGWRETARKAEGLGFDVLLTADHIGPDAGSPLLPLAAAAQVTTRIRLGTLVLNNDFHHPLLLAREAAALDRLSDGRFELGLGAGYGEREYDAAGIAFDRGATRVDRLGESVAILDDVLRGASADRRGRHHRVVSDAIVEEPLQRPRLPFLLAGHRRRVLDLAARSADIVGLSGLVAQRGWIGVGGLGRADIAERIAYLRAAAGERFAGIEVNALVQRVVITDDPGREAAAFAEPIEGAEPGDLLDSPFLLLGSVASITEQLERHREELGITYYAVFEPAIEAFAPVVARLSGS
jgi:probable F420-dependent oxidoreductase